MDGVTIQQAIIGIAMGRFKAKLGSDDYTGVGAIVNLGEVDEDYSDYNLILHYGKWELEYRPKYDKLTNGDMAKTLMVISVKGFDLSEVIAMLGYALMAFNHWDCVED